MKKGLGFVFLVTLFLLAACGGVSGEGEKTLPPVPAEYAGKTNPFGADAATAGATVYATNCAACHGDMGLGDGPAGASLDPAPANLVEINQMAGEDFIYWTVNEGVTGTSMVAWKGTLTDEEIWQVVAFVRTLK